ncbi:stearoyl-CoA desaturase (delta-9 desaturase) [Pseudonocardia ammonioxydans]|uniref:Stearoyl-CoA desaturase (Delta-9 desaturase) n=1 Tax=Pseudonocardia ammonioxydans TaxID=260086 RepID=A0A1I4WJZ9_PSUAM|nr:acyl-CoA desaturase [Pseudonocardia ammonioxydans]SFN13309.1 stearoyl-CoA desaturase (delta-9 desaturase) [Pseudonocardia ammonioxydans]
MTLEAAPPRSPSEKRAPAPITDGQRPPGAMFLVGVFVILPTLALFAAIPLAWGWGLGWVDVALFAVFYMISGLGVTVGFHRYFTHGSFKAKRPLRIALAIAGSLSLQGGVLDWVGDHRRHHAFSDKEGDPHSPWLYGTGVKALVKGFWHSHMGWLFDRDLTNMRRFAPDLVADKDMDRLQKAFPLIVVASLLGPALIGGLVTMSWWGAFTAFFWAGLVRVAVLHHVTWSINSICHIWGERPFASRDKSANVWWLAVLSFGESWHNLHHADPTCARHGVKKGQIDISAVTIRAFEKLGWATNVRWPTTRRLEKLAAKKQAAAAA